jgi:pantoate kinase
MFKTIAFAPAHISGFFEPIYDKDLSRSGSRGAGINLTLGSLSEVTLENSTSQKIFTFINNRKSNLQVTKLALKLLIGDNPYKININTKNDLPFGQGFGMSAATALSATYACAEIMGIPKNEAMKASHFAEVSLRTGLGDVMASSFGGVEIRKSAGLPPWGIIEHIPGQFELVLCIIGKKLETKKVLQDPDKNARIIDYGKYCVKNMLQKPSVENFFYLSETFAKKTELANKPILDAINAVQNYGVASMCMLGNSVFAIGKTDELSKILSTFGRVYICKVDELGARIIK